MANDQQTLGDQVFEQMFDLILSGELPLGGVVNEVSLAQRFNISRGPIREAVQRLQGLRLITREPYMKARVVSLSGRDIIEIFQLREAAEGMACRLAAETMPIMEIDRLSDDLERNRRLAPTMSSEDHQRSVFDIHVRLAEGCGNQRITRLLCEELYHLLRIYRARSGSVPGRHGEAFEEHWQIVRAIRVRDASLAESLMRTHINRATQSLLNNIEDMEAPLKIVAGN